MCSSFVRLFVGFCFCFCLQSCDFHLKDNFQSKWCLLSAACVYKLLFTEWLKYVFISFGLVWKQWKLASWEWTRERARCPTWIAHFSNPGHCYCFPGKKFVSKLISTWFSSLPEKYTHKSQQLVFLLCSLLSVVVLLAFSFCIISYKPSSFQLTGRRTAHTFYQLKNCPFFDAFLKANDSVDVW